MVSMLSTMYIHVDNVQFSDKGRTRHEVFREEQAVTHDEAFGAT